MSDLETRFSLDDTDEQVHEEARRRISLYRQDPSLHEEIFSGDEEEEKARLEVFEVQLGNIGARFHTVNDLSRTSVFVDIEVARKLQLLDTRERIAKSD